MASGMVDGPVPDTAMDTKSEQGDPGGADDTAPLSDDERAMLHRLRTGGGTDVVGAAAEESPAYAEAADDDAPLPADPAGAHRQDPLDPVFREPSP